jgi:hypothetical protein
MVQPSANNGDDPNPKQPSPKCDNPNREARLLTKVTTRTKAQLLTHNLLHPTFEADRMKLDTSKFWK